MIFPSPSLFFEEIAHSNSVLTKEEKEWQTCAPNCLTVIRAGAGLTHNSNAMMRDSLGVYGFCRVIV